jgi:hypothetical protein
MKNIAAYAILAGASGLFGINVQAKLTFWGFAKQFFGIWLSPQTSEPAMRRALLAQLKTVAP